MHALFNLWENRQNHDFWRKMTLLVTRSSFARRFQLSETGAHRWTPSEILDPPLDTLVVPLFWNHPWAELSTQRQSKRSCYVGSAGVVLLDAVAVGGSVSAERRKKPSPVVHSRTVTVRVLAVTSVILTLSISDLTPGGGSHTSAALVEWTGDQCAGLQRFTSGDSISDDVVLPATLFPRTFPDSFLLPSGVLRCAVTRSRFCGRRPVTSLFWSLNRSKDGDEADVSRAGRDVLECCRTPYVAAASSSTDRDAAVTVLPLMFRRESSSSSSSSSSLVSFDDTDSAVGEMETSSVSLDSLDSISGWRARAPRPAADRRLLSAGDVFRRPCSQRIRKWTETVLPKWEAHKRLQWTRLLPVVQARRLLGLTPRKEIVTFLSVRFTVWQAGILHQGFAVTFQTFHYVMLILISSNWRVIMSKTVTTKKGRQYIGRNPPVANVWLCPCSCVLTTCTGNSNTPFWPDDNTNSRSLNKKLIRRWDSQRELSLRQQRTRTTKYNRLVHKFRHRSTWSCVGMQVYQIQRNNAM